MAKMTSSKKLKLATSPPTASRKSQFKVPAMPPGLPLAMKPEYTALIKHLHAAEVWDAQKMGTVEVYLYHLHLLRRANLELDRDGFTLEGRPHPANSVLAKAGPIVLRAAASLGLVGDTRGGYRPPKDDNPALGDNPWSAG
jgi:hypothetical protein